MYSKRFALFALILGCQTTSTPGVPGLQDVQDGGSRHVRHETCRPPNTVPTYAQPPDDSVAVSTQLSASSYYATSTWVGMATGNVCGDSGPELVLLRNQLSDPNADPFTVLRGSTPYKIGTGTLLESPLVTWTGVAAGPLDASGHDAIVAVRQVTNATYPDVTVTEADSTCNVTSLVGSANIGGVANSNWVGVAMGKFRPGDTLDDIVLLRNWSSGGGVPYSFVGVQLAGSTLTAGPEAQLDTSSMNPWVGIAAGDLDGDGQDEMVAAQQTSTGVTIFVYDYSPLNDFFQKTTSYSYSFTGQFAGMTVGDFNGDGKKSIVVSWNAAAGASSNVAVLSLSSGVLHVVGTGELEADPGQRWVALAAADIITAYDHGEQELVALRNVQSPYRVDLFLYGDPINRVQRDSGLIGTKSQGYDLPSIGSGSDDGVVFAGSAIQALADTHANTFNWNLGGQFSYTHLINFLDATTGVCDDDGQQIRVWITLYGNTTTSSNPCSQAEGSTAATFFSSPETSATGENPPGVCAAYGGPSGGWPALLGTLAQQYPQIVEVGFDDFSDFIDGGGGSIILTNETVSEFKSRLQDIAPWVNFAPTFYYVDSHETQDFVGNEFPDYGRLVDTVLFFFRNDLAGGGGQCDTGATGCAVGSASPLCAGNGGPLGPACTNVCVSGTCSEATIPSAPSQFCNMRNFIVPGRQLQLGLYWDGICDCGTPTTRYDYDLTKLVLDNAWLGIGGVSAYGYRYKTTDDCSDFLSDSYCTLAQVYGGGDVNTVTNIDLTAASCLAPPPASGQLYGLVQNTAGYEEVLYRTSDNHVHDIWRRPTSIGDTDLTVESNAMVAAVTDPTAFISHDGTEVVLYLASDSLIHEMTFSVPGLPTDASLSAFNGFSFPSGVPSGVAVSVANTNLAPVYRNSTDIVVDTGTSAEDLSSQSDRPIALSDPFPYESDAMSQEGVVFATTDHHLHNFSFWLTSAVVDTDLTAAVQAANPIPAVVGDPVAYFAPNYSQQDVFFRGSDNDIHTMAWVNSFGYETRDLTAFVDAPQPEDDPIAYFVTADGSQHVVFRGTNEHYYEITWVGAGEGDEVFLNDLTNNAQAFPGTAVGNSRPSAYYDAFDGTHHVIYQGQDGDIHDLYWGK